MTAQQDPFPTARSLIAAWSNPAGRQLRFAAFALRLAEIRTGISILEQGPRVAANCHYDAPTIKRLP